MRLLGYYWGIFGVIGLIASVVSKLIPRILELDFASLGVLHWFVLVTFTPYMAFAEGYKGFHLKLAPRVVARTMFLKSAANPLLILLAPLFCMGYFHATPKRMLTSWLVSSFIALLVVVVSYIPQPWRGIIDVGVMVGLVLGIGSLFWHFFRLDFAGKPPHASPDLP